VGDHTKGQSYVFVFYGGDEDDARFESHIHHLPLHQIQDVLGIERDGKRHHSQLWKARVCRGY